MTDKNHIPLGKQGSRTMDAFVETGALASAAADASERDVTNTFRIPESLGCRLKVHAAQAGQKEKDILVDLIAGYLVEKGA